MAKVSEIIEKAESYIGTKEEPANSNNVVFNTHYYGKEVKGDAYPWCCAFVWDIFRMCNASPLFFGGGKTALCAAAGDWYKKNNQWHSTPAIGDLVFFKFSNTQRWTNHIGIVKSINPDGSIVSIEGNTSSASEDNGGCVLERKRNSNIVGYGRPSYETTINNNSGRSPLIKGIDVSSYQGKIDWERVTSAGYTFAILRGVIKDGSLDSSFFYNYENAKKNGIELSCYQFSYALSEAEAVDGANNMISRLRGINIPIWLDLEWDKQGVLGRSAVTKIAKAYVNTCTKSGYECNIYSNLDWFKNKYNPNDLKEMGCKFWIARYAKDGSYQPQLKPGVGEIIWQYTSQGQVDGITGKVDLNIKC